jgi:hypothetical protein
MGEAASVVWEFLHDAVLDRIVVDWEAGTATLSLDSCEDQSRQFAIKAEGLRALLLPRREPWGQGGVTSVNDMRQRPTSDGGTHLDIEMQSGDRIEIEARQINVSPTQPVG